MTGDEPQGTIERETSGYEAVKIICELRNEELRKWRQEPRWRMIIAAIFATFAVAKRKPEKNSGLCGIRTFDRLRYRCSPLPKKLTSQRKPTRSRSFRLATSRPLGERSESFLAAKRPISSDEGLFWKSTGRWDLSSDMKFYLFMIKKKNLVVLSKAQFSVITLHQTAPCWQFTVLYTLVKAQEAEFLSACLFAEWCLQLVMKLEYHGTRRHYVIATVTK